MSKSISTIFIHVWWSVIFISQAFSFKVLQVQRYLTFSRRRNAFKLYNCWLVLNLIIHSLSQKLEKFETGKSCCLIVWPIIHVCIWWIDNDNNTMIQSMYINESVTYLPIEGIHWTITKLVWQILEEMFCLNMPYTGDLQKRNNNTWLWNMLSCSSYIS